MERPIQRWTPEGLTPLSAPVGVEYALKIYVNDELHAITMCSPGREEDLAIGLLVGEGIIGEGTTVDKVEYDEVCRVVLVNPAQPLREQPRWIQSACGICGDTRIPSSHSKRTTTEKIESTWVASLPEKLTASQSKFESTGNMHAVGRFEPQSDCLDIAEDIGRHNAMDKVLGRCWRDGVTPAVLVLSGRVSFEMVQKAIVSGAHTIVAIGAPSDLAIDVAREHGLTLIGFARAMRFNVYCGAWRLASDKA